MQPVRLASLSMLLYGALAAVGGLIGFLLADSVASLVAGGLSGALLIVGAIVSRNRELAGLLLGLVVALALFGRFVPAALKAQSAIALVMTAGGLLVALACARALLGRRTAARG